MQIAKNTFDIAPVNSSGVRLVGSVILYAGSGDESLVDAWCTRYVLGECKLLVLPSEHCDVLFEPTTRGKNTVEIQYKVREPIQTPGIARRVAKLFSETIAIA